jgi:hypothetical protein
VKKIEGVTGRAAASCAQHIRDCLQFKNYSHEYLEYLQSSFFYLVQEAMRKFQQAFALLLLQAQNLSKL